MSEVTLRYAMTFRTTAARDVWATMLRAPRVPADDLALVYEMVHEGVVAAITDVGERGLEVRTTSPSSAITGGEWILAHAEGGRWSELERAVLVYHDPFESEWGAFVYDGDEVRAYATRGDGQGALLAGATAETLVAAVLKLVAEGGMALVDDEIDDE